MKIEKDIECQDGKLHFKGLFLIPQSEMEEILLNSITGPEHLFYIDTDLRDNKLLTFLYTRKENTFTSKSENHKKFREILLKKTQEYFPTPDRNTIIKDFDTLIGEET